MPLFSKSKNKRGAEIPQCTAVIAAGGASARMSGADKLFIEVCGAPVLAHTLRAFEHCPLVSEIIVVARTEMLERAAGICAEHGIAKAGRVIAGGDTRFDSVYNGVFAVSDESGLIAIHDGARPCVGARVIELAVKAAAKHHAAVPAIPVSSTVKRAAGGIVNETVSREGLFEIQTPQVFDADLIKAALTKALKIKGAGALNELTDDCMAVEMLGVPVYISEGSRINIKITTQEDILLAEAFLAGTQIDSHFK